MRLELAWAAFHEAFKLKPGLKLEDLRFTDTSLYVKETLAEDERMVDFYDKEPVQAPWLVREIVPKADGVFLWVLSFALHESIARAVPT